MPQYLIAFFDDWVPDYTDDQMRERSGAVQAFMAEMRTAGVFVFLGGLDETGPVFHVSADGEQVNFVEGPREDTKDWLGGCVIVDVPDDDAAKVWAGKAAIACGWPQEARRFRQVTVPRDW